MDLSLTGPVLMVSVKHDKLLSAAGKQVGCLGTDASTMPNALNRSSERVILHMVCWLLIATASRGQGPLALASFLDDLAECAIADMERINTLRSAMRDPGRFIQNSASWLRQFFTSDGWICDYVECKRAFGSKKVYGRTHRLEGDYCP